MSLFLLREHERTVDEDGDRGIVANVHAERDRAAGHVFSMVSFGIQQHWQSAQSTVKAQ